MRRGADNGIFAYEEIAASGGSLQVKIFHKNSEEAGPGSEVASIFGQIATSGVFQAEVSALKELVRYQVIATGSGSSWVLYRTLGTSWYDTPNP